MIKLTDINKSFGNIRVLSDINLEIGENQVVTILGPSGAGKTTLLQIAGTLDLPDSGTVCFDGKDMTDLNDSGLSAYRNRNIGFIFQFHQLLPEFSACENVAIPAMIAGLSKRKAMDKAAKLLELVGLGDRLTHKPSELSGGERQRTAIARALINEPKVVMADEPTGSLDSQNRDEIYQLIADLKIRLGVTFIIVSHDLSIVDISDRVIRMADGRIIEDSASANAVPDVAEELLSEENTPDSVEVATLQIGEVEIN